VQLRVLASGSSGNCSIVSHPGGAVLLDCGLSLRAISAGLREAGLRPQDLEGILITHEHGDHVGHLASVSARWALPVYASEATLWALATLAPHVPCRRLEPESPQMVAGMTVTAFRVPHDGRDPLGFRVDAATGSLGVATDLGWAPAEVAQALADCDQLAVECNHDVGVLQAGPYPAFLKRRILSQRGHLSNEAAAQLVRKVAGPRLRRVIGLHLSQTNNAPELAREALEAAVAGRQVQVELAPRCPPSRGT